MSNSRRQRRPAITSPEDFKANDLLWPLWRQLTSVWWVWWGYIPANSKIVSVILTLFPTLAAFTPSGHWGFPGHKPFAETHLPCFSKDRSLPIPSSSSSLPLVHFRSTFWVPVTILRSLHMYSISVSSETYWVRPSYYLHFLGEETEGGKIAQLVKNPPAMQETLVQFWGWKDLLEKG